MFDAKKLFDALIAAAQREPFRQQTNGRTDSMQTETARGGAGQAGGTGVGTQIGRSAWIAKDVVRQYPALAPATLIGLVGLLLGRRKSGGLLGRLATLGGLALVGALAYRAYRDHRVGEFSDEGKSWENARSRGGARSLLGQGGNGADLTLQDTGPAIVEFEVRETFHVLDVQPTPRFHSVSQTEDDALLYLRTMVAAAVSDGQLDARERRRIIQAMVEAGIDPEASRWLEREMAAPADIEELVAAATTPEKAAQIYTAARIVLDPDTVQEREFLRLLAEELDLEPDLRRRIDDAAEAAHP